MMNAFKIAMMRIDGINPANRLPVLVDRDREIFKAGMVYAGDIAEVGTSKTPAPISRHSIRMRKYHRPANHLHDGPQNAQRSLSVHPRPYCREPRRGELEAYAFAEEIIANLNLPKNAVKGTWGELEDDYLYKSLLGEVWELRCAMAGDGNMVLESADVGAYAMMFHDRQVKKERQ